jgi:hypothetical protein
MSDTSERPTPGENEKNAETPTNEASAAGKHELTARERAAVERMQAAGPALRLEFTQSGVLYPDHANKFAGAALLAELLGTTNGDFANGLIEQLCAASETIGQLDVGQFNYLLAGVTGFKPRDQVEAMLSTLATVFQAAAMREVQRLLTMDSKCFGSMDARLRAEHMLAYESSKLGLTFVAMIDGLMRYRARIDNVTRPERRPSSEVIQTPLPPLARSEAPAIPTVERPVPAAASRGRKARKLNGHARP